MFKKYEKELCYRTVTNQLKDVKCSLRGHATNLNNHKFHANLIISHLLFWKTFLVSESIKKLPFVAMDFTSILKFFSCVFQVI